MAFTLPPSLMGFQVNGDLGPNTIYTNRFGKKVSFPKSPPKTEPSDQQRHARERFSQAQAEWSQLSNQVKTNLEDLCRQACVPMTGQNLWIHTAMTNDAEAMKTLIRQTGILVPIPDYIP